MTQRKKNLLCGARQPPWQHTTLTTFTMRSFTVAEGNLSCHSPMSYHFPDHLARNMSGARLFHLLSSISWVRASDSDPENPSMSLELSLFAACRGSICCCCCCSTALRWTGSKSDHRSLRLLPRSCGVVWRDRVAMPVHSSLSKSASRAPVAWANTDSNSPEKPLTRAILSPKSNPTLSCVTVL